jgi:hypothetical protein
MSVSEGGSKHTNSTVEGVFIGNTHCIMNEKVIIDTDKESS